MGNQNTHEPAMVRYTRFIPSHQMERIEPIVNNVALLYGIAYSIIVLVSRLDDNPNRIHMLVYRKENPIGYIIRDVIKEKTAAETTTV